MSPKNKDWPVIIAGTSLGLGITVFLLVGIWFATEAPDLVSIAKAFPIAPILMAFGCVFAIGIGIWRTVRFFVRGPEPESTPPEAPAKIQTWKQALVTFVAGILLAAAGSAIAFELSESTELEWLAPIGTINFLVGIVVGIKGLQNLATRIVGGIEQRWKR